MELAELERGGGGGGGRGAGRGVQGRAGQGTTPGEPLKRFLPIRPRQLDGALAFVRCVRAAGVIFSHQRRIASQRHGWAKTPPPPSN